ncbi:response regulator transcription factor [Actinoplanes sp. L3-i22]|uniref:response regulator transcription factor n=1 Tax=Actinoplanes sp. L3-i22 TaxID=2836373 RepID=UPI001C747044|nr:response regulator transcription factor [Actinoplanes sp. L3-i22]BCY08666.1 DNA-binding response regulator [Actinoplanes sp. L3-i22]
MTVQVLVVDDDEEIREVLAAGLTFAGFAVTLAANATEAYAALREHPADVVVLDVMMPGQDGFDVVQLIRRQHPDLPVLFLSARDAVEDKVRGLRLGGDDYMAKPFSAVELVTRIEVLVRRSARGERTAPGGVLRCADLELDPGRHVVRRGGAGVELSPTEFRLLHLLLINAGQVLSKGQILDALWQYDFGGSANLVERFVSSLRRKVDDGRPALIRTVRGFGYSIREPQ